MEKTFITIHNLGPDADILFASDSITDILDYEPSEVLGKSSFDYFHPDEVPFAQSIYKQGILLDKAAVLQYARIRSRSGHWVGCECVFTVVYDVLVAATSIYHENEKSQRRAINAPLIRRIFSCSPRDPRYHMLEHLSAKFRMPHEDHEPRAALILNRFTRSLGIMYATEAVSFILGIGPDQLRHKSFYECIQESCLADAIHCMENAKANDSIAYLRFWSRDPRRIEDLEVPADFDPMDEDEDEEPRRHHESSPVERWLESENRLSQQGHPQSRGPPALHRWLSSDSDVGLGLVDGAHRSASSQHTNAAQQGVAAPAQEPSARRMRRRSTLAAPPVELEAVISCASDGLVVVIRKARPKIPGLEPPRVPNEFGRPLAAAPWVDESVHQQDLAEALQSSRPEPAQPPSGPQRDYLMNTIRDIGVFAWALVGINGNLASHSRGSPTGEAQPPDGIPVWDPTAGPMSYEGPYNQALYSRKAQLVEGGLAGTTTRINALSSGERRSGETRGRTAMYGDKGDGSTDGLDKGPSKRPREGSSSDQHGSLSSTSLHHASSWGESPESSGSRESNSDSSRHRPSKRVSRGDHD